MKLVFEEVSQKRGGGAPHTLKYCPFRGPLGV